MRRREFLNAAAGGGAAALFGLGPGRAAAEPPPETDTLRLLHRPTLCEAPQYVAEELLKGEGFRDVQYLKRLPGAAERALAAGDADISMLFGPPVIVQIDAGAPIVFLSGVHVGCVEMFAADRVKTFRDLKGRTVAITELGSANHVFVASIAAHVGLRPSRDITWAVHPTAEWGRLLLEGRIDAFLGYPPLAQELRARKIGHVVVNTLTDRPWSQYFCCMVAANREFMRRHPVATKRALRAILKASDMCALEPERIAKLIVDKGHAERSDYVLQSLKEVAYGKWRDFDPADAVRFYALRLREAELIKASPQQIIARGTDWRFLNELKKELRD
jgi:NitT/TauT family transport system substrate-binding protein